MREHCPSDLTDKECASLEPLMSKVRRVVKRVARKEVSSTALFNSSIRYRANHTLANGKETNHTLQRSL